MKKTNRGIIGVILLSLIILVVCAMRFLPDDSSWQPTVEAAWEHGRNEFEKEETEIFEKIDLIYYEKSAVLIFITREGNLIEADFEFDAKKEKWHCYSIGKYGALAELEEKWSDYEMDGERLYTMLKDGTTLSGMRYHDGKTPCVNGEPVNLRTYEILFNGNSYQVDYWDVIDFKEDLFDEIILTYQDL